ncbi:amidohydrolase [Sporolactobacillus sp. Y61]|uniref:Amidohydrolase n=1 Tax=Sporolactobacillus sp. Y61 TaxID=3160863 RepID=A0AAU8IJR6_9BACL
MAPKRSDAEVEKWLVSCRRQLHREPELAFEEYKTTARISKWLDQFSIRTAAFPLKTGALAVIGGQRPGPTIALRSDIDALPITEQTGLPFASVHPGKMHACGHDVHMATMLGAARLLKEREEELSGTVKIIFQPAEENGNGAIEVLKTGLLDDVQSICGMHIMPSLPTGTIGIRSGPLMAAVDRFIIDITGIGTHGATPEKGSDTIVAATQMVGALQTIISRNTSPLNQALISVTRLEAGNTWNVMPDRAQLEGTVRTFSEEVRENIEQKMKRVARHTALALGTEAHVRYIRLGPPVVNDPLLSGIATDTAAACGLNVVEPPLTLIGEDFAEYQKKIPGSFFFMGVSGNSDLHHPDLIVDEQAVLPAARFFTELAGHLLRRLKL